MDDTLEGGEGDDDLRGGWGNDRLLGGQGSDSLDGGDGQDTLIGGAGDDLYFCSDGDVIAEEGGEGIDTVYSFIEALTLAKNVENLVLGDDVVVSLVRNGFGNEFNNRMTGNAVDNVLVGGGGNDTLFGEFGYDRLVGGAGRDFMTGGGGNDIFDFNSPGESSLTLSDVITDFVRSSDTIDLSTIDARTDIAGNQAFKFIGKAEFTSAGQVRFSLIDNPGATNDLTRVEFDRNDDGAIDFRLTLKGLVNLTAGDFEL